MPGATGKKYWKDYTGDHSHKHVVKCRDKKDGIWPPFNSNPTTNSSWPHHDSIQRLNVFVNPNPSSNSFMLKIQTKSNDPITVTVSDNFGNVMERFERINPLGMLRFGDNLKTGIYFVEIRQGEQRKTITVLKIR